MSLTLKQQFIIALVFICAFLAITGFVVIYGIITKSNTWAGYQPYFTALIGPLGVIFGYYFRAVTNETTKTS